jgi:hypothetical protein
LNVFISYIQFTCAKVKLSKVEVRMVSRLLSYNTVAPWPVICKPVVHRLSLRPLTLEALHVKRCKRPLLVMYGITGNKHPVNLACDSHSHRNNSVLLHVVNLRHETDGFTTLPKESMLWIFSLGKSNSLGRFRTLDLGYQRTACRAKPLKLTT